MDAKLAKVRPGLGPVAVPRGGWVKAIRESLGMTAEQLGARLGIGKQSVLKLERNEQRRTVTMASLERAATALGCRLAYVLVPASSLEALVDERSRAVARKKLARVKHSMALEAQEPPAELHELQVEELARALKEKVSSELWEEP